MTYARMWQIARKSGTQKSDLDYLALVSWHKQMSPEKCERGGKFYAL